MFTNMDGSDRLTQQENSVINDTGLLHLHDATGLRHDASDTTTNKHLPTGGWQCLEQSDMRLG